MGVGGGFPVDAERWATARYDVHKTASSILCVSLFATGCMRELPPPAAPPRQRVELETLPDGPIPAGSGRVVLDAQEGKGSVRVVRVDVTQMSVSTTRGYAHGLAFSTHLLCSKTPCAVDLPAGSHQLTFQALRDSREVSTATFDVTAGRTQVVRHAVGFVDQHGGWKAVGVAGVTLGFSSALPGALFVPLSGIAESDGMRTAGFVMLGAGLGVLAFGITSLVIGRTEVQPGTTTQWTLKRDEADDAPTTTQGQEQVRRQPATKPTVIATGNGVGMAW